MRLCGGKPKAAIQSLHIFQAVGVDNRDRLRRFLVGPGPLPDGKLDRHAVGADAARVEIDQGFQPCTGLHLPSKSLFVDRGDAALRPFLKHRVEKRAAVAETAVKAPFGDAEPLGHDLDADLGDAAFGERVEPCGSPAFPAVPFARHLFTAS